MTKLGSTDLSASIQDTARIGLWAFEIDEGKPPRMYVDDAMLGLIGLKEQTTPEETYHAWYDHVDPAHYDEVSAAVEKMVAGMHAEVQYPWHHPEKGVISVRCGGKRNFDYRQGVRIEGCHQDVTSLLHFQKEAAESRQAYKSFSDQFVNQFTSAYYVNLDDGSMVICHRLPELKKKYGTSTDFRESAGRYIADDVHPDDRQEVAAAMDLENIAKRLRQVEKYSILLRDLSGAETKWLRMEVIRGADASHAGIAFIDITAEIQTENARKAIIEELTADYETVCYVRLYADKYQDSLTTFRASARLAALIPEWEHENGFTRRLELLRNKFVHPDDRENFHNQTRREVILPIITGQPSYFVNFRALTDGRTEYHQMKFIARKDAQGAVTGCVVGLRNADAEIRRQQEQKQALEDALRLANAASAAKTTFLNNMSHDIRTPMNAIIGYTGLASKHLDNRELVQDYLEKIGQSSDHLLSLINDVLDMSRIESGKMALNESQETLSEIIHTLRNIVLADVHAKNLDFVIDTLDVKNEAIVCDKLRLNQVLLNVLSNAIKYTPNGGRVSLRLAEKTAAAADRATYEFRVKDNGMGMSRDFLTHLFEPFTRVSSSTISGIQGTGLGMAITKSIIDMMHGTINVTSEEKVGTEVAIEFTFKLGDANRTPEAIPEVAGWRGMVVDDNMDSCSSIAKLLRDAGIRSEWCAHGKEAVYRTNDAIKANEPFDLYIIDWVMPDMNGVETARRIRALVGDHPTIIILTAYDWSDIETEARQAGVNGFINKPLFPSDLRQALRRYSRKNADEASPAAAVNVFAGTKVLLVEDNELNREIAAEVLADNGLEVTTRENGALAVELLQQSRPGDFDLVLMDVQMPVMDGYEATRRIRALPDPRMAVIPVIAMTANAFEEDKQTAMAAGMNSFVTKPFKVNVLLETMGKVLNGGKGPA